MSSMNFDSKDLIVYRPEAMNRRQKVSGWITLSLFWITFFYLFRPVFVTIGWFIFGYFFHETMSMKEAFWSEVLAPIHVFMLVVLMTMVSLPFWVAFKENYTAKRLSRTKLNIEKIIVPDHFVGNKQVSKLPQEIIATAQGALKITCHFDHKSNINVLNLDGNQIAIENGRVRPITVMAATNENKNVV